MENTVFITSPSRKIELLHIALKMLPQPITLWDHITHYLTVRDIMHEMDAWARLSNINIAVVGLVRGGEFKPD